MRSMPSESAATSAAERAAIELGLDELLAMRPLRVSGPFARGRRGPGGERAGRGHAVSLHFEGIAPYAPGDDVRWIDWRDPLEVDRKSTRLNSSHSGESR